MNFVKSSPNCNKRIWSPSMKSSEAKKLAKNHGCELWWDKGQQLWVLSHPSGKIDADYIPAPALTSMEASMFKSRYLLPMTKQVEESRAQKILDAENPV